jgi:hypothetical protein
MAMSDAMLVDAAPIDLGALIDANIKRPES